MRTKDLALIALFCALICVLGLFPRIQLPLVPAPLTSQTIGIMLAGGILGAKRGFAAVALFVVLVALGLPVLVGGAGGLGAIAGPTGGFILAYPLGALVTGWLVEKWWSRLNLFTALVACIIGSMPVLYLIGHTWLAIAVHIPVRTALWSWVAYVPGDLVKAVVAAGVIVAVKKAYPLITPRSGAEATPEVTVAG